MENQHLKIEPASNGGDKSLAEVFAHSAAYTLVQSPINAVTQLVDRVADTNVLPAVQLIEAPETVEFSLSNPAWYAQQFGNAGAMAAHLYLLNKAAGGKTLAAGREVSMSARSAAELTAKSAGVGALYSGVFTPVSTDGNFWQNRAINSLAGAVTFASMSASAIGTKTLGQSLTPVSRVAGSALKNDIVAGTISGVPAGIVSADTHSLLSGRGFASGKERFESAYGFAVIGGGLSAMHAAESKLSQHSTRMKNAISDGTLDWSPMQALADRIGSKLANSLSIGPQFEIAGTGGMRAPLYTMSSIGEGGGKAGSATLPLRMESRMIDPASEAPTTIGEASKLSRAEPSKTPAKEVTEPKAAEAVEPLPGEVVEIPKPKSLPGYSDAMTVAKEAAKQRAQGNQEAADRLADEAMQKAGLTGNNNYANAIQAHIPEGSWRTWSRNQKPEPALKQSLALMSTAYGPGHPKVINTLELLLDRIETTYNGHNLKPIHRRLLDARKTQAESDLSAYADGLQKMADFQSYHGKYDNAINLLKKAAEVRQKIHGTEGIPYVQTVSDIANLHIQKRAWTEAEPLLLTAKETLDKTQSGDRLLNAKVLSQLGHVYNETGRRAEAEPLLVKAIETGRYAPDAANLVRNTMTELAGIYLWWGRIPEAKELYSRGGYRYGLPRASQTNGNRTVFDEVNSTSNPYQETLDQLNLGNRADSYYIRQVLTRKYSWAIPNEEALATVAEAGPIVEIGAGTGYWAALMRARGADVIAYDKHPMESGGNHYHPASRESWTKVEYGDESAAGKHPDRTLLLSWPVYDEPVALNALTAFKGNRVVYIGEGWGGCTGDNKFHTMLDQHWKLEKSVDIPQWDGIHDWLRVYTRKTQ